MSGISTKNIKVGGGPSKTLEPGNQICKINAITLEANPFKEGAFNIVLHMESQDLGPDFQGFFLNKDDESLGRYKGAVGRVRATEWPFADGKTKGGVPVTRDGEIVKFLTNLSISLGCKDWLEVQDGKHQTLESLIAKFNEDAPFKDTFLKVCLAGKEYKDKKGYLKYDLYLPKYSRDGAPFAPTNGTKIRVVAFNEAVHIKRAKVADVQEFGNTNDQLSDQAQEEFNL